MDTVAQEYFNVAWPLCLGESKATGVFPEIIFAQTALETGYGLHHPQNNYFGIKGSGESLSTIEVVKGVANKVMQHFAGYASMASSFQGYATFLLRNRRYTNFRTDGSISAQLVALGTSGYATDPNYAMKVGKIVDLVPEYLSNSPYAVKAGSITAKSLATTEDIMNGNTTTDTLTETVGTQQQIVEGNTTVLGTTSKVPHKTGLLADLGHEADQLIVDPIKALVAHKSALQVAANLITGLLPYAPLPAPAATAITDIVNGISAMAQAPVPVAPGSTVAVEEAPVVAEADPVAAAPAINPILADAIQDGEELLEEVVSDFFAGNLTKTNVETQFETEVGKVIKQGEELFAPALGIAKDPNSN